ncbi:unnamed protein product, partial [Ectocarpus sp. 13 AM-2016]
APLPATLPATLPVTAPAPVPNDPMESSKKLLGLFENAWMTGHVFIVCHVDLFFLPHWRPTSLIPTYFKSQFDIRPERVFDLDTPAPSSLILSMASFTSPDFMPTSFRHTSVFLSSTSSVEELRALLDAV